MNDIYEGNNKITIEYSDDAIDSVEESCKKAMTDAVISVLKNQQIEVPVDIAITLTDNEDIREINKNYRQTDKETDVLSFPMIEYKKPGVIFAGADDYEDDRLVLGDIVISVEKAQEQAEEYGHSKEREFAFLAAHSTLHLLGYDHMTDEDEKTMFEKQEKALSDIGLTR